MCGIVGIVSANGLSKPDHRFLEEGTGLLAHRGPDGEGTWADVSAGFGHRRLAVIDVAGGRQPMQDSTGRYTITYNGEIYNYRENRADLEKIGHSFRTQSDTEVVLNAYAEWGVDCVDHLDGIFAFGIWDSLESTLFLARDHLGVKPLLYYENGSQLIFASELKVILKHPAVSATVDALALSDYLSLGYVLSPKTIVKGIRKLEPASRLIWKDGAARVDRYWDLAAGVNCPGEVGAANMSLSAALDAELRRAVAGQLVSDIPVGLLLSGGLDSSTVADRMVSAYDDRVKTFSMGFRENTYSEAEFARLMADRLGTEHHEETADPDLESLLPALAWYYDEPFADTSAVPTYCLCRLASQYVKVVLSGDGGDECFAGYDTYLADKVQGLYKRLVPGFLHRGVVQPLVSLWPAGRGKVSWNYKIKQFCKHVHSSPEEGHYSWRLLFSEEEKRHLWDSETGREVGDYRPLDVFLDHYRDVPDASPLNRSIYVDIKTWLADGMLVKVDRASMACGLEVRVPLLDRRLVEFAMLLPDHHKLRGFRTKALLRDVERSLLPAAIIGRPKRGFNSPVAHWIGNMRPPVESGLLPGLSSSWRTLMEDHARRRADNGFKLWTLLGWSQWQAASSAGPPVVPRV